MAVLNKHVLKLI